MLFLDQLIITYFGGIAFLILALYLGRFISAVNNKVFRKGGWDTMVSTFCGLLLLISLYAISKSSGNTIMWGLSLILVFFIAGFNKLPAVNPSHEQIHDKQSLLSLVSYYSIFYIAFSIYFFAGYQTDGKLYQADQDFVFGVDIVEGLKKFGAENFHAQFNNFEEYASRRQPYHYFEFWIASFLSELFRVNSFFTLLIGSTSILLSLSAYYIKAIAMFIGVPERFAKFTPALIFLKLIFLFSFLSEVKTFTPTLTPNLKSEVYLLFIYFSIYIYLRYEQLALIPIVGSLFASISSVFAICGLAAFVILIVLLKKRYKVAKFYILCVALGCILLGGFYIVNGFIGPNTATKGDGFLNFQERNYRTMINIVGGAILQHVALLLPWILSFFIIFSYYKSELIKSFEEKKLLYPIFFAVSASFSGLIAWAVFYQMPDSVQFFSNFTTCVISALLVLYSIYIVKTLLKSERRFRISVFIPFLVFFLIALFQSLTNNFIIRRKPIDVSFSKNIIDSIKYLQNSVGGYFMSDIKEYSIFSANRKVYWSGGALKSLKPDFTVIALNIHKVKFVNWEPIDIPRVSLFLQESPLYRNKPESFFHRDFDYDQYILNSVKNHKIDFILAEKDAVIPDSILLYYSSNFYEDPVTGLRYFSR